MSQHDTHKEDRPVLRVSPYLDLLPLDTALSLMKEANLEMLEEWYGKEFREDSEWMVVKHTELMMPEPQNPEDGRQLSQHCSGILVPIKKLLAQQHFLKHSPKRNIQTNSVSWQPPVFLRRDFVVTQVPVSWEEFSKEPHIFPIEAEPE